MTNQTSEFLSSESVETNLHQRKKKKKKSPKLVLPTSEKLQSRQSLVQWLASYFTYRSKKNVEIILNNDQNDEKQQRSRGNYCCSCQHFFLKLILFFCVIYLILFFRPDYSVAIRNSIETVLKTFNLTSEEFRLRPGQRLARYRQPSMPIIIIPGIISTGLELWRGTDCAKGKFRHRFWTSMQMVGNIGRDHQCWLKHLSLNLSTW